MGNWFSNPNDSPSAVLNVIIITLYCTQKLGFRRVGSHLDDWTEMEVASVSVSASVASVNQALDYHKVTNITPDKFLLGPKKAILMYSFLIKYCTYSGTCIADGVPAL